MSKPSASVSVLLMLRGNVRLTLEPVKSARLPWPSNAEHQRAGLQTVADLTAKRHAASVVGAVGRNASEIPSAMAQPRSAVCTDIETGPIVHRNSCRSREGGPCRLAEQPALRRMREQPRKVRR